MKPAIARNAMLLSWGLAWLLSACAEAPPPPSADRAASTESLESVDPSASEIVFWYQHSQMREEALLELIAVFNRNNPHGISVRGEYAGRYGDIYNKMTIGLQGGDLPDLVVAYQNQAVVYAMVDGLVDLSPYMESPKWGLSAAERADYVEAFLEQDIVNGAQICFPPNRSLEILYYNADWLEELGEAEPPTTWPEFERLCRLARERPFSGAQDPEHSLGYLFEAEASRLATMVFTRGGDFMNATHDAYTLDTTQMREALSMVQRLTRDGAVDLLSESYQDQSEFAVGNALFMIRSSSGLPFVHSAIADASTQFDWKVAPPPRDGEDPILNVYGASISVCRSTPERQLAAWLFLKWFTTPEQQARWIKASNYFPVRRSTARELESYFEENPRYGTVYSLLDYGKPEPSVPGYQAVRRMIEEAMVEVAQGGDIAKILERIQGEANRSLQEFQM